MSATEVIEEIKKLSSQEQKQVFSFVKKVEERQQSEDEVSEEFKFIAGEVFTKNAELFRKLAQ